MSGLVDRIKSVFKKTQRSVKVFGEYDNRRGFAAYNQYCKSKFVDHQFGLENHQLTDMGYKIVTVIGQKEAHLIRSTIESHGVTGSEPSKTTYKKSLSFSNNDIAHDILESVFNSEIGQLLSGYFESEYMPYWYNIERVTPNPTVKRSFLWHCDKGPSQFAKILLYLTSTEECGGDTQLISQEATLGFDRIGYVFGAQRNRKDDLSSLAARRGLFFDPISVQPKAGQALIFLPQKILHRGIIPDLGPRHVMQTMVLPSPVPWQEALNKLEKAEIDAIKRNDWVGHADELRSIFDAT